MGLDGNLSKMFVSSLPADVASALKLARSRVTVVAPLTCT